VKTSAEALAPSPAALTQTVTEMRSNAVSKLDQILGPESRAVAT
jgi:hypothetical protein